MREQDFRAWLETYPAKTESGKLAQKTISTYMTDIKRVVGDMSVDGKPFDIDAEFGKDSLLSLIKLYNYTKADEDARKANPTKTDGETTSLSNFLNQYKRAVILYRRFLLSDGDVFVNEEQDTSTGATFGLEADLQDVIRETIAQLEAGLTIIDGGVEEKVATGFIDILARDSKGCLVVIELKAGKANAAVIGQILGYMVATAEKHGLEFNQIRGIIVAGDFNKRVRYATRAIPNLSLKSYRYAFNFKNET